MIVASGIAQKFSAIAWLFLLVMVTFSTVMPAAVSAEDEDVPSGSTGPSNDSGPTPRHKLFIEKYKDATKAEYKCAANSKGNIVFPAVPLTCGLKFLKVAMMAICGNEWFDQMKHCALAHFFKGEKPNKYSGSADEDYKETLILIDGCATCSTKNAKITKIMISHTKTGGGFFSNCGDEQKEEYIFSDVIEVVAGNSVDANTSSFTVPVVLKHRMCGEVFGMTMPADEYKDIELQIEHDCGGDTKKVKLPDINLNEGFFSNYRVGEIRGLHISLDGDSKEVQYVRKVVNDSLEFKPEEPPKEWADPDLDCWTQGKTCDPK